MATQLKNTKQKRVAMIKKICPKEFSLCLLIKDETFGVEQKSVLRSLVPEKFPNFIIAQVILQTVTGWKSWLPLLNRGQCHALALLPTDYQRVMLTAAFLTGSLREVDSGRVLLVGLGARSIAFYIQYHSFRVEIDELIPDENDEYLNKIWLGNQNWNRVTESDIPVLRRIQELKMKMLKKN
uniref:Uncharacterized protein n=1 Tax=Setaria digitata TaxID=48799 RepID=A0A915Q2J7_9BILA